ncbi:unnamed protein product [Urochloa decumbens]|uniref:Uncharacterized protein n=1 Tax=Urochloa decumbens TaxID=240449 RepID=A0ABC8WWE3_9POAL
MALAATFSRFGYASCNPNDRAGRFSYHTPPTKSAAAAGNGVPAIRRSNSWRCRSTATASSQAMAAGRRQEKKGVVDEEEEWRSYLAPERLEVVRQLEPWMEEHVLPLLKSVEESWQPSDMLPDPASDGFREACLELRAGAAGVPDDILVCLVANMVTEEALPTYPSGLNHLKVVRDSTGADATAWARWIRGWSAEENRHGDVLNRYIYLSGRFDMREVERTVQRLIRDGMTVHAPASPFHIFVYVAFQERATAIAHGNTARLVGARGDAALSRVCGTVAADEKRHEAAYTRIMGKIFEADPDAAVRAMAYMIRQWGVGELAAGLSGEGRRARDYLCALPDKIQRMEEKAHDRAVKAGKKATPIPISWIFGRTINVLVP